MLILTRKIGEAIVVNNDIVIRLLDIKGGQIKIGVDAPNEVAVHREEIFFRILEENKRAATVGSPQELAIIGDLLRHDDRPEKEG